MSVNGLSSITLRCVRNLSRQCRTLGTSVYVQLYVSLVLGDDVRLLGDLSLYMAFA